jgi:hypothetical protein
MSSKAFFSAKCVAATILICFLAQKFRESFRNRSDQMGVWLLLPALSPLVELVLVSLSCFVGVAGATTVLLQSSCKNQKGLEILLWC